MRAIVILCRILFAFAVGHSFGPPHRFRGVGSPIVPSLPTAAQREEDVHLIVGERRVRGSNRRFGGREACLGIKHIENGGSAEPEQAGLTSQTSAQPSLISVLPVA
jgi:hypothetical protein